MKVAKIKNVFVYSRTTTIHAPIQVLYDFHLNAHNLRLIFPLNKKIERLEVPACMEVGAQIEMVVNIYGWRQHWKVFWEELQSPHGKPETAWLVDVAKKSPFSFWKHRHFFASVSGGTEMTDRVEYEIPF